VHANKTLSATIAVVGFLMSTVWPSWAGQADSGQIPGSGAQTPVCEERVWENRTFQQADWKATIILDPCVPEAHAIRILRAIEKQNLVNAQPAHPLTGVVPSVPTVRLSQVQWIGARWPTGRRVDGSEAGPFELYDVRTVSLESGLWGLSLRVSVRDDYVELRSVGAWLE